MTHIHWSTEHHDGECPTCKSPTAQLFNHDSWTVDDESPMAEMLSGGVETGAEVTCHWCELCREVTSVSINT